MADLQPPELAQLVDFAERPRAEGWSLRSALVRYAQPHPVRVGRVLEHIRRAEWALHQQVKVLDHRGPELWAALQSPDEGEDALVTLLRAVQVIDELGDVLAAWAVDRSGDQPDEEVDSVTADVGARLDALGIRHEERQRPAGRRGV